MQKLHVVGFTPDLDGLILSTRKGAKSGGFVVAVDAATLERLAEASAAPQHAAPAARNNGRRAQPDERPARPESLLTPREMQELLRGGWSLEEVASEAGVDVDWVSRFAAPVLAEMNRVLDRALECAFDKPRVGVSALPLGASVRRNAAERGVRFTDEDFGDAWRAAQLHDDLWLIGFDYLSRGRTQSAEWVVDLETDEVTSNNRLGTQLGHVQSARRRVDTSPPPKPKPKMSAGRASTAKAAATPPSAKRRAPAPAKTASRARSRSSATSAKRGTAKRAGAARGKSKPHGDTAEHRSPVVRPMARPSASTLISHVPRHDPWREELRRRELERSAALDAEARAESARLEAARLAARVETARADAERVEAARVEAAEMMRARLRDRPREPDDIGARRVVEAAPPPESRVAPLAEENWRRPADDEPSMHIKGPLPPPAPIPLPEESRERASHPLGVVEADEPPATRYEDYDDEPVEEYDDEPVDEEEVESYDDEADVVEEYDDEAVDEEDEEYEYEEPEVVEPIAFDPAPTPPPRAEVAGRTWHPPPVFHGAQEASGATPAPSRRRRRTEPLRAR